MNDYKRPLSDIEKLALLYIEQNPKLTCEDITNYFEAGQDDIQKRTQVTNAVEYLVWNGYVNRDNATGSITARGI